MFLPRVHSACQSAVRDNSGSFHRNCRQTPNLPAFLPHSSALSAPSWPVQAPTFGAVAPTPGQQFSAIRGVQTARPPLRIRFDWSRLGASASKKTKRAQMEFALSLIDNGILTPEEFVEAVKLQVHARPQIGTLAVQLRKLNCRQVFAVLDKQCKAPAERFGDLAVELGYLAEEDLNELLATQSRRTPPMWEILIENRILPSAIVEEHHRVYRQSVKGVGEPQLAAY